MKERLEKLLPLVETPARYTGNEVNSIKKSINEGTIRFCMGFPDVYEVGMSHLGIKILYSMLNDREDVYCERVFAPWTDMEDLMRENEIPLFSLETQTPVSEFDFVGFTLQYEMSYTNILNMLDLAGVQIFAKDRDERSPLIIFGGPCAYNPEPIAEFADMVIIGEGEEVLSELMDLYSTHKNNYNRKSFLKAAARIQGVYVPEFYKAEYNDDGTLKRFDAVEAEVPEMIKKRFVKDLDNIYYPDNFVVPYIEIVHDRSLLELFRGCTRGCRFCQAGMIYRPLREKSLETLKKDADALIESTGYEEISLSSLSTMDYTCLPELTDYLMEKYAEKRIAVGLPSLRIDSFSIQTAEKIQQVRKTGLTFAPEAGTQRMRDVINKGVTEEDLISSVSEAFDLGWGHVKLYFMIGLPTETMEDVDGIAKLGYKVLDKYFETKSEKKNKKIKVVVSTSSFVPKAFTPFQWVRQDTIEEITEKQRYLIDNMRSKMINYSWHDPKVSYLEGVFARGDRKLAKVLYSAFKKGCKFDGSKEHFNYEKWLEAFKEEGIDPDFYTARERSVDELFPWDFIDMGVTKAFLAKEYQKALQGKLTGFCKFKCENCGFNEFEEGWKCHVYSKSQV
ncbi:TIGR03960 family B12-binding radical SAM protein [Alkalibacter mobilis]|uniref:TIGR03960 family B12-binding radical SAM protein n=1 Tax=Alkalibacter mobilis TaxID=2787712 RepID=UPI00189FED4F|nr:TIGR03960 family B12-binding radical SAM protein [Alkalibacter mobilis]MBF7096511.1 TIGR03960 family B12-binding radical SAM protein [Alkalibacter mobilis]